MSATRWTDNVEESVISDQAARHNSRPLTSSVAANNNTLLRQTKWSGDEDCLPGRMSLANRVPASPRCSYKTLSFAASPASRFKYPNPPSDAYNSSDGGLGYLNRDSGDA